MAVLRFKYWKKNIALPVTPVPYSVYIVEDGANFKIYPVNKQGQYLEAIVSNVGVETVSGDGVDNTDIINPIISYPNADQVDDTITTNKFVNQGLIDLINTALQTDQTVPQTVVNGAPIFSAGLETDYVLFDTTYIPTGAEPQGSLYWNEQDNTLDLVTNEATVQIGQELYVRSRNTTNATIPNGTIVYIKGQTGIFPDIAPAKADAEVTGNVLGITTEEFLNNAFGMVTTYGYVRGIKTNYTGVGDWGSTWVEGDALYLSRDVAGKLTNIQPDAPHHSDKVATVNVIHPTLGSILVLNNSHVRLQELADVALTPLIDNDVIKWIASSERFEPVTSNNWDTAFGWGDHSTQGYLYNAYRLVSTSSSLLTTDYTIDIDTPSLTITLFNLNDITESKVYNISNSSGGILNINTTLNQEIYLPGGKVTGVLLNDGESLTIQRTPTYWRAL